MTSANPRHPEPDDANTINDYYDELVSGVLAPGSEIDPDLAAAMSRIQQLGNGTAEPPGLRAHLWEELMSTSASTVPTDSLRARRSHTPNRRLEQSPPGGIRLRPHASRPWQLGRWLIAALIVLSVAGGTWWSQRSGGGDPTPTTAALAPYRGDATPTLEEQLPCSTLPEPYLNCPNAMRDIAFASLWTSEGFEVGEAQAQIQGWAITPGSGTAGGQGNGAEGGVIDFVINGAYTATFNTKVMVRSGGWTNDAIQYVEAGQPVEIVRGGSVSYPLGSLIEIKNPLSEQRLEFKRAVVYRGDISALSATADGVTTRVEGDTVLPTVGPGNEAGGIGVGLTVVQIYPGIPFPPASLHFVAYIGPVDPQTGPPGTQGFVLYFVNMQG